MNRDYRDYPASIWDAIGDVDQGICCAALGGVVWDFMSHLTPAQLLAAMDSAALETLRAIRPLPRNLNRPAPLPSAGMNPTAHENAPPACLVQGVSLRKKPRKFAPAGANQFDPFSPATCASGKTPLRLCGVCPPLADKPLRAADCIFFSKKWQSHFSICAPACSGRGASVYFLAADSSFSCLGSSASGLRRRRAFSASQIGMGAMARASTVTHWVRSMGHTENTP